MIETKHHKLSENCRNRREVPPAKDDYPANLKALLFSDKFTAKDTLEPHRRHKMINYRQLNNSVALGYFTANIQKFESAGPDIFEIAGQPHHNTYA